MWVDSACLDPTITTYLQSFGRYGMSLAVVCGPGAPTGIALPELVTSGSDGHVPAPQRGATLHLEAAE
jgi:hypothetical protein